jgi:hypothetical protein
VEMTILPTSQNEASRGQASLDDLLDVLEANQNTLKEILTWLKVSGAEKVRQLLQSALDSPDKRVVYHLSDGRTTREIAAVSDVSAGAVSIYWKRWYRLGLMKKINVKGGGERHFRSFDLDDYGIELPKVSTKTQPAGDTTAAGIVSGESR